MSFEFPKILLFGDSITEYAFNQYPLTSAEYAAAATLPSFDRDDPDKSRFSQSPVTFSMAAKLADDYRRRMDVVHRGYAGYNSDQALKIARALLLREHDAVSDTQKFKLAIVYFGTNDCRRTTPETGYMEGVPIDRFEANMAKVADLFVERDIKLILVTPGIHDDVLWDVASPGELSSGTYRTNARAKHYGDVLKSIAAARNVPLIDMYTLMKDYAESHLGTLDALEHGGLGPLVTDGIHFSGTAYKILYDAITNTVASHWPQITPEQLHDKFPHWSELKN